MSKLTKKIKFSKMHGAGNDYIYVNTLLYNIPDPAAAAVKWSDRHTGIGADGLVLIGKPSISSGAQFSMRIFNADGSEAMMCGNASRCVGKYLYERRLTHAADIRLETLSGVKTLHLHLDGNDMVQSVTVDMLPPVLHCPGQYDESALGEVTALFRTFRGTFVSMGNPHFVIFTDSVATHDDVARYGRELEHNAAFPQRCNIEFACMLPDGTIRTRVWERGSGITQACGTGACATAVAAALTCRRGRASDIVMDGGTLHVEWNETDGHVYMTGPAAFVFDGEAELP